jgi:hypothetical protein
VLSGLVEEFGASAWSTRRFPKLDSPASRVGAAMTGLRPVVDIMFGDFITLTMDQMVNQAAKVITCRAALEGSHGDAHHAGRDAALGGAAFAVAARLVQPCAGIESGSAFDALRREGPAEDRDPRRESGRLFRRQDDVQAERPGAGRGLHDSSSAWPM